MNAQAPREKIVILGGGFGALSTAWYLTNDPTWQERYEITVHTLGWRLGGKCASSRNMEANGRVEEHGIHGFLGCYYNALKMMSDCYEELGRAPGTPLATAREAFLPVDDLQFLEFDDGKWKIWPITRKPNDSSPWDDGARPTINHWIRAAIDVLSALLPAHGPLSVGMQFTTGIVKELEKPGEDFDRGLILKSLEHLGGWTQSILEKLVRHNDDMRRLFIEFDYVFAIIRGVVADDVINKGFDIIDCEDYTTWLKRHGASDLTLSSPLAIAIANTLFAYPSGDTTLPASLAASVYVQWALQQFAYLGSIAWKFAGGTGETVIAPLYLVLKRRGVGFEFFHRVDALRLSPDAKSVASVDITVQAELNDGLDAYDPLIDVDGLPCWPALPRYEHLKHGERLGEERADLESYWTSSRPAGHVSLLAGRDFDRLVFALSIGAVPNVCGELLHAGPRWQKMVDALPAIQTQSMQIWLSAPMKDLGWELADDGARLLTATYIGPTSCVADFSHLLHWERRPDGEAPAALLYLCGPMAGQAPPPPGDASYPKSMSERVKWESTQYLQVGIGPILPGATNLRAASAGDPVSLDFRLLSCRAGTTSDGVFRFDHQFWRANIDPTERYVTSPPGSTSARLRAWESGFTNLIVAGDWTYTGLNAGCVEGAVMSGMLACYAITGSPAPESIPGYEPHKSYG